MKKIFYYCSTALILSCGIAQAQTCVPTPTCSSLGYTSSSSCDGGLKCPFGNYWNCDLANKVTELEKKLEQQMQDNTPKSCGVGYIFYSDRSCSMELDSSKTPIGVVVYDNGFGHGQVMSLQPLSQTYKWASSEKDIPELTNFKVGDINSYDEGNSLINLAFDIDSCINSAKIMAAGNKDSYPAVWAAHEYSTEGTSAGDWCLPAAGILLSVSIHEDVINKGLERANAPYLWEDRGRYWSSTEYNSSYVWTWYNGDYYGMEKISKTSADKVRPVLSF